ncbi:MAG: ABC transporter permease [Bacteroidales bacterium]
MDALWVDVRHALRGFRAHPGLTAVAVLSLAIGIGPNAAIFSLVDALGFRPLAIQDPNNLLLVSSMAEQASRGECSYPEFADVKREAATYADVAASAFQGVGIDGGSLEPGLAMGFLVSGNYFSVLGVRPLAGRALTDDDDRADRPPTMMISERLWRHRFDRDPRILGRTIRLNRTDFHVVGIVPASFNGTGQIAVIGSDVYVPFSHARTLLPMVKPPLVDARGSRRVSVFARLHAGVTLELFRGRLGALGRHLEEAYPDTTRGRRLTVEYEEKVRRGLWTIIAGISLAIVGLILLIACANVAGLLLGRSEARTAEIAVRLAMGASRWRLIRQLLTESAVLSAVGAALGLLLAWWFIMWAPSLVPASPIPIVLDFRLDARLLAFTLATALLAVPAFGLTPALLAARREVFPALKRGSDGGAKASGLRLRHVLVVGQVAVSLALLVSAGLLLRSYANTRAIDPGFVPRPMVFATMAPQIIGYDETQTHQFYHTLIERLEAQPGVERASLVRGIPLNSLYGSGAPVSVAVAGHEPPTGEMGFPIFNNIVGKGYFETMGIRLVRGRDFADRDRDGSPYVVVVNQSFARRFWPNADPVGQYVRLLPSKPTDGARDCQVVGIVQDSKYLSLTEAPRPYLYLPYEQNRTGEMNVITRGRDTKTLAGAFRRQVTALDRSMPITQLTTIDELLRMASVFEQSVAAVVSVTGTAALFLSVIGLYGVIAFVVARRTREIGIRIALGATPRDVIREVLKGSARLSGAGMAAGLTFAVLAGQVMRGTLYGVSALDPLVFVAVSAVVALIATAAALVPARRAARVDPLVALRCE